VFKGRWGTVRPFLGLGNFEGCGRVDNHTLAQLITPSEVLANFKNRPSPGPDGITKERLLQWDPQGRKLVHMFSSWPVAGSIPGAFKKCQTTLIPKTSDADKLGDINNWRPITIGSVVLRILTGRMTEACPIHPGQRGFIASPGCSENLTLLAGVMKMSQAKKRSLGVVFVDFAKAVDPVSHEHLLALGHKGLDPHMQELIGNSYKECVTQIKCQEGRTSDIKVPFLLNISLDPLVQKLE